MPNMRTIDAQEAKDHCALMRKEMRELQHNLIDTLASVGAVFELQWSSFTDPGSDYSRVVARVDGIETEIVNIQGY
jgi:hypothetical protein